MGGNPSRSASASVRSDYVDPVSIVIEDSVEESRRSVRQHGTWSTGENRRHQVPSPTEQSVSDGIGALMHSVEASRLNPPVHDLHVKTKVLQLPQRNHSVLSRGKIGDGAIDTTLRLTGRFPYI
jgi:hypothetical protein